MGHNVLISTDFFGAIVRKSGIREFITMQGHHNTPFTIENILNGSVFSKRENRESKSMDTYSGRIMDLVAERSSSPEGEEVDIEGEDSDSGLSCTLGSVISSDPEVDRIPTLSESGPEDPQSK